MPARFLHVNCLIYILFLVRQIGNPTARLLSRLLYRQGAVCKTVIVSLLKDFDVRIAEYL